MFNKKHTNEENMYDEYEYVDPITPEDLGWVREEDMPNVDFCEEMLRGILDSFYNKKDPEKFEDCLDELCGQFGISLRKYLEGDKEKSEEAS